ncbi:MAG TPA: hypothetical protein VLH79_00510 [Chthonomonadales bacterium]|nr:hypothetical protein [Chthonomonadales bacterium]
MEEWQDRDPTHRPRELVPASGFAEDNLPTPPPEAAAEVRDAVACATACHLPYGRHAAENLRDESAGVTHRATRNASYVRVRWLGRHAARRVPCGGGERCLTDVSS